MFVYGYVSRLTVNFRGQEIYNEAAVKIAKNFCENSLLVPRVTVDNEVDFGDLRPPAGSGSCGCGWLAT